MYTFGCNSKGQLGHSHTFLTEVPQLKATKVSCGDEYTVVLTTTCELLITGKLPFNVNKRDYLRSFEQLAKFEKSVVVKQIESSKFTTILAQLPGQDRTEMFLWGMTPLGIFKEPISLNQLINETQQAFDQNQLDVLSVKNGSFFSIFVEKNTGVTF